MTILNKRFISRILSVGFLLKNYLRRWVFNFLIFSHSWYSSQKVIPMVTVYKVDWLLDERTMGVADLCILLPVMTEQLQILQIIWCQSYKSITTSEVFSTGALGFVFSFPGLPPEWCQTILSCIQLGSNDVLQAAVHQWRPTILRLLWLNLHVWFF